MFGPALAFSEAAGAFAHEGYSEFAPFQPDLPADCLEERYTTEASRFVEVGGARVHVREEGPAEAPVVLALHGMYSSLHTWEEWTGRLTDRFRMVRLDLPGFGLTGPNDDEEYDMSYYVDLLAALMDRLGLSTAAVAGNSLGGGIAWRFAVAHPDRVERLLLLDSIGRQIVPDGAGLLVRPGMSVVPRYLTPRVAFREILRDAYGDPTKLTRATVRRYHDLLRRTGNRRAVITLLREASPGRFDPGDVRAPTLVQWGSRDSWLPLSLGRSLAAEIPDAGLRVYEGVGHMPMEEAPGATAPDAAAFLS